MGTSIFYHSSSITGTESSDDSVFKLLSWNLDGLDPANLEERTKAVVENILLRKPDVVLLQEVVAFSLKIFQESCQGWDINIVYDISSFKY